MKIKLGYSFNGVEGVNEVKKQLNYGGKIKFVMIESKGEFIAKIFTEIQHSVEAIQLIYSEDESEDEKTKKSQFIGAGVFQKDLSIVWDSQTCHRHFGYDKPKEHADQIAAEFKDEILKIIE